MTIIQFIKLIRNSSNIIPFFGDIANHKQDEIKEDLMNRLNSVADELESFVPKSDIPLKLSGGSMSLYDKNDITEEMLLQKFRELKDSEEERFLIIS